MKLRKAFTLIELLIVIVIISILAGMLLPALLSARRKAKQVQCLSNIRQLNQALISYTINHNSYLPFNSTLSFPGETFTRYSLGLSYLWNGIGVQALGMLYESGELTNLDIFWGCTEPFSVDNNGGDYSNKNPDFEYGWSNWKVSGKNVVSNYQLPGSWFSGNFNDAAAAYSHIKYSDYYPCDVRLIRSPRYPLVSCTTISPTVAPGLNRGAHYFDGTNIARSDGSAKWQPINWSVYDQCPGPQSGEIFAWANAPHIRN